MLTQRKKLYLVGICICIIVIILDQLRLSKSTKENTINEPVETETKENINNLTPETNKSNIIIENKTDENPINDFKTSFYLFGINSDFDINFELSDIKGYEKFLKFSYRIVKTRKFLYDNEIGAKVGEFFFLPNDVQMTYLPSKRVVVFGCKQNSVQELLDAYSYQEKIYYKKETNYQSGEDMTVRYHKYPKAKYHCLSQITPTSTPFYQDYYLISVRDSIHANLIVSDYHKVIEYLKNQQVKE